MTQQKRSEIVRALTPYIFLLIISLLHATPFLFSNSLLRVSQHLFQNAPCIGSIWLGVWRILSAGPKTKLFDAERREIGGAFGIVRLLVGLPVLEPVELEGQPRRFAKEIENVGTDGMLAAEFVGAESAVPQPAPHQFFRPGGLLTEGTCALGGHGQEGSVWEEFGKK